MSPMIVRLDYDFSTATTAPPTSNQLRFDGAAPYTDVTHTWIRMMTTDGRDVRTLLLGIPIGARLYVQDKNDSALFADVTTTAAPVDLTDYVDVPVVWRANGDPLLNNQAITVYVIADDPLPVPPDPVPGTAGLVTLQQAVDHLRIPIALDDLTDTTDPVVRDLTDKVAAAEAAIVDYLKTPDHGWTATTVPPLVRAAILLQLGELWRFRGDDLQGQDAATTDGNLSPVITNLLRRYRMSAVA